MKHSSSHIDVCHIVEQVLFYNFSLEQINWKYYYHSIVFNVDVVLRYSDDLSCEISKLQMTICWERFDISEIALKIDYTKVFVDILCDIVTLYAQKVHLAVLFVSFSICFIVIFLAEPLPYHI